MSQYNAQKNPPWARPNEFPSVQQQPSLQQQMMNPNVMQYPQQGVPSPQQASVYQAQLAMQQQALSMQQFVANNAQQMYNPAVSGLAQANVARSVNSVNMMPGNQVMMQQAAVLPPQPQQQQQGGGGSGGAPSKQRVFTGTVTKVVDTYGFVDEDVFFQMSCVKGPHPVLHDRVLVEAVCLPTMPFKWNATRVQVLPMESGGSSRKRPSSARDERNSSYSAVPPPNDVDPRRERERDRDRDRSSRDRDRTSRGRSPDLEERRRRRERREREDKERERDRDKDSRARSRSRSRSPRRARAPAPVRKYRVRIPEFSLDVSHFTVSLVKSRYPSMYIPSDFFAATARWTENFPQNRALSLAGPARFHVLDKEVEPVFQRDDVVEPPDADFLYSAKVMLLSIPPKEELVKRCVQLADEKESSRLQHPARLIDCLVGTRGKNEYMAIGGPWSPSLDGEDPLGDPGVLIKTAIRTCRALTGVDLSSVTRWYRFAELHYHRAKTAYKSREVPARVETVIIYTPDVWSVMPSALEWDGLHLNYQRALDRKLVELGAEPEAGEGAPADDEKEVDAAVEAKEPTHWSKLDLKVIKVNELREELAARNMSPKGLRLQLIARLSKVLKQEQEAEEEKGKAAEVLPEEKKKSDDDKKNKDREEKDKEKDIKEKAKERAAMVEKYKLPETPHIIVHPCKKAKGGKFNCKVVCLSLLLDYTQDINKEHTFEVSLFAENLNEMIMRDFGLQIYKALTLAPEKVDEKEKKEKGDEKEKKDGKEDKSKDGEKAEDVKKMEEDEGEESKDASEKAVTVNGKDDDDDDKRKRKRNGKKRERLPLKTINTDLLLAFSYFDTTHYGKMATSDLEELMQTLGLNLSRAQIKKLVAKLSADSYLDYRKLTDAPAKSEKEEPEPDAVEKEKTVAEIVASACSDLVESLGNKQLIPSFSLTPPERKETSGTPPAKRTRRSAGADKVEVKPEPIEDGLVSYRGTLINVENLQEQLKKNEASRLKAEEKSLDLRHDLNDVKEKLDHINKQLKDTRKDLLGSQKKLEGARERLEREMTSSDIYLTTLMDMHERIFPILDTDEIRRLVTKRQQLLGAPEINLVPLTKVEEIVIDDVEMEDAKEEKVSVKVEKTEKVEKT